MSCHFDWDRAIVFQNTVGFIDEFLNALRTEFSVESERVFVDLERASVETSDSLNAQ
jgi:hypothetical protein